MDQRRAPRDRRRLAGRHRRLGLLPAPPRQ
jgi:hypothetical protein